MWRLLAHNHWFSVRILGKDVRLCARCSGYCSGYLVNFLGSISGVGVWPKFGYLEKVILVVLLGVPVGVDWITQSWRQRKGDNTSRFLTGILAGTGAYLVLSDAAFPEFGLRLIMMLAVGIIVTGLLGVAMSHMSELIS